MRDCGKPVGIDLNSFAIEQKPQCPHGERWESRPRRSASRRLRLHSRGAVLSGSGDVLYDYFKNCHVKESMDY
ncbi:Pectinesterase [Psidium guajava]|nr:Pectinesterase [Psidium guajava]